MLCHNCGMQNADTSKFCIKCGSPLINCDPTNINQPAMNNSPLDQQFNNNQPINTVEPILNQTYSTTPPSQNTISNMSFGEYFKVLISIMLKPFTAFNTEISKFDNFKNSALLSFIIAIFAMVATLLKTMYNTVKVTTGGWLGKQKTEWVWENLKEIEYVKVIGKNLLIFLGIIFAIACVYYIAGLIVKKQSNFSRLLGIAAIAIAPMIFCALILSPLLSVIYGPLGMGITIVGSVYTFLLIYEAMNKEILLEGNIKYYFNIICLSILLIV